MTCLEHAVESFVRILSNQKSNNENEVVKDCENFTETPHFHSVCDDLYFSLVPNISFLR